MYIHYFRTLATVFTSADSSLPGDTRVGKKNTTTKIDRRALPVETNSCPPAELIFFYADRWGVGEPQHLRDTSDKVKEHLVGGTLHRTNAQSDLPALLNW